eukprot:s7027_g5.t1
MASCRWRELLSELTRELEQQSLKLRDLEKENQRLNDSRLSPHESTMPERRFDDPQSGGSLQQGLERGAASGSP